MHALSPYPASRYIRPLHFTVVHVSWGAARSEHITFTLEAMSHRQSSYRPYYRVTIGDVREMQLVVKRARLRSQTLTQSLSLALLSRD